MNKLALITFVKFLVVVVMLNTALARDVEWKEYRNKQYGFSISLPETWEIKDGYEKTVLVAVSPAKNRMDRFRENINLNVQVVPNRISIEQYYKKIIKDMQNYLISFKEHSNGNIKIDGIKSKYMVYSHKAGEVRAKVLEVIFLKGSFGYKITCTALDQSFDDYKGLFKSILSTFTLNN